MSENKHTPNFEAVKDKRMSELTPEQQLDAKELWLRNNIAWMSDYHQEFYRFLLSRVDVVRKTAEQLEAENATLRKQRDELLAALTKLSEMKLNMIADGIVDKAIARVKGEQ